MSNETTLTRPAARGLYIEMTRTVEMTREVSTKVSLTIT